MDIGIFVVVVVVVVVVLGEFSEKNKRF